MSPDFQRRLQSQATPERLASLAKIQRGIEKESLRITPDGTLAQTAHPAGLGSALTHSSITTDYSEALLEFITPVSEGVDDSLQTLENIHRFVYSQLDSELLWSASMPCIMGEDSLIPVAQYGNSNVARMKTIYRVGLGHRYGRLMQTISGIHYNFSMPRAWWEQEYAASGAEASLKDYVSDRYLGLIRNFQRHSWLLVYLFGASPATCASFLKGSDKHGLEYFDEEQTSLYLPYATSLRMGDLGYQSNAQKGLKICYNSLDTYIETLKQAILQPHPDYADIGIVDNGEYRQLNNGLLQIENEFYSPIRPKRVTRSGEIPLGALKRDGIEYIEVRCVDVSPFSPLGIEEGQIRFLDTFLLFCLLEDSPLCDDEERDLMAANLHNIVNRGREPALMLHSGRGERPFKELAASILNGLQEIALLLDQAYNCSDYSTTVTRQRARIDDPELTPSARILREMREQDLPFYRLALNYSRQWEEFFRGEPAVNAENFADESEVSIHRQSQVEAADELDFAQYLARFYQQYQEL